MKYFAAITDNNEQTFTANHLSSYSFSSVAYIFCPINYGY